MGVKPGSRCIKRPPLMIGVGDGGVNGPGYVPISAGQVPKTDNSTELYIVPTRAGSPLPGYDGT